MVRARASKSLTVKFLILLWKFIGEELEMVAARHGSIRWTKSNRFVQ